jgi:hypothetical protein
MAFDDATSIIEFLNVQDKHEEKARSQVTCALIKELQEYRNPVSSLILTLAFFPGLLGIYRTMNRIWGSDFEDMEWLIVESFLDAAQALPIKTQGKCAVVNLFLGTKKLACKAIFMKCFHESVEVQLREAHEVSVSLNGNAERLEEEIVNIVRRLFYSKFSSEEDRQELECIFDNAMDGLSLAAFARKRFPKKTDKKQKNHYRNYRKQRQRFLTKAKARVSKSELIEALF